MMKDTREAVTRPHDEGRTVPGAKRRGERLIGLLLAGMVLLNFPVLSVFSVNGLIFGIPVLYLYLFSVWILLIIVKALILRGRPAASAADKPEAGE
jgi:hypothetical protein